MNLFSRMLVCFICFFSGAVTAAPANTPAKPAVNMTLNSNAYLDNMAIPVLYTCDGKDVSPLLSWTGIPQNAQSLAIIMKDVNAPSGDFYHWVLFNLSRTLPGLAKGTPTPGGAVAGKNSFGKSQYSGPCPPKGAAHTYTITLYALDTKLDLPKNADADAVLAAIKNHIIGQVDLSGTYSRWIK